ncbi:MAG TPA: hypothetical protein PKG90_02430 [Chitinophagaceae bacterium]|nr:hypothetical protein [Chitinophagaceae bacterium]
MKKVFWIILTGIMASCSKDNNNSNQPDNITVITINTPVSGFTYLNGGIMRIEGEINDPDKVATARVQVKNKTTNTVYFDQTSQAGNITHFFFLWDWNISGISSPVVASVIITAKDVRGFEISRSTDVNITL